MDYTKITLGELLSSLNETIRRNAMSILHTLQKIDNKIPLKNGQSKKIYREKIR